MKDGLPVPYIRIGRAALRRCLLDALRDEVEIVYEVRERKWKNITTGGRKS